MLPEETGRGRTLPWGTVAKFTARRDPGPFRRTWPGLLVWVAAGLALCPQFPEPLHGQLVEEFYPAFGGFPFGEQPEIRGGVVIWQRYGDRLHGGLDSLQCRDIDRPGSPVVDLLAFPASEPALLMTPTHLFLGPGYDPPGGAVVRAWAFRGPCELEETGVDVSPFGWAVAANERYVFILESFYEEGYELSRGILFAKPMVRLSDPDPGAIFEVGRIAHGPFRNRIWAASERYLAWVDVPDLPEGEGPPRTWKVFVRRAEDIESDRPPRVIDTKAARQHDVLSDGVYIALHDSLLVFEGAPSPDRDGDMGIYLLDLDSGEDPVPLATNTDPDVYLHWPAVSGEYVVWTKVTGFFRREAFGVRLAGGRPSGEPFEIAPGGSWITIDRNIAVANGGTRFDDGNPNHGAIVAWELESATNDDVGDVDGNGKRNVTDVLVILNYLFKGGPRPRLRLADLSGNRELEITDAVRLLLTMFPGN